MYKNTVRVATPRKGNAEKEQWMNEKDYKEVRKNIDKWPEWKRRISNTDRPEYAKPF